MTFMLKSFFPGTHPRKSAPEKQDSLCSAAAAPNVGALHQDVAKGVRRARRAGPQTGYAVAVSLCTLSDTEEASFGEESATVPSRWLSGVDVRDFAVQSRSWSDGLPIGSGHGSPYLQEPWAALMHQKLKTVEGRPNDGVRSSSPPPC